MSELADRLDGWSNWFRDPDDTRLPKTDHISVMREAAAALRSQEWVSVEDGLPEHGIEILWYCGGCQIPYYKLHTYHDIQGQRSLPSFGTHWMPLPPPPEEPEQ